VAGSPRPRCRNALFVLADPVARLETPSHPSNIPTNNRLRLRGGWIERDGFSSVPDLKVASARQGLSEMTRMTMLSNPLLLGFEDIERMIDRAGKGSADGYPPYNIERIAKEDGKAELLRITLAVAGFSRDQLDIILEDNQLIVRGKQTDDKSREYLYRGIAARQFARTFVLADGIEVKSADLSNGLLSIDLHRLEPEKLVRRIEIGAKSANKERP
jgi:HSP20 family molecular chaperone IbpA